MFGCARHGMRPKRCSGHCWTTPCRSSPVGSIRKIARRQPNAQDRGGRDRDAGAHSAPVESDPARAREVRLPGLRSDHPTAGPFAPDRAWVCRAQAARPYDACGPWLSGDARVGPMSARMVGRSRRKRVTVCSGVVLKRARLSVLNGSVRDSYLHQYRT
jgi:hypothetical protein